MQKNVGIDDLCGYDTEDTGVGCPHEAPATFLPDDPGFVGQRFPVVAVGPRQGEVAGIQVLEGFPVLRGIHTISLYLKPEAQHEYVDYILSLRPRRIIFNKKTYNPVLAEKAIAHGIRVTEDCTLVMLAKGMYEGD
jgi:predicted CoA-binding protein